ncbi:MurR/RpiR family transcriptional regulator [Halomonas sp. C05BenzN]|uniref:MurR/RpiR family transcriptional regulator n=1 Tax=Halomonas sp. C05BenzN TaxID=3411041 RepID=UPI003B930688
MPDTSRIARPPETVEALRALSLRISRGETELRLGPKAQEVLARLIELNGDQALLSISTAARQLQVNPSTISRLARSLGYERFSDLQGVLLSTSLSQSRSFYRDHASTALKADRHHLQAQADRLCAENRQNIERFAQGLEHGDIEAFAQAVMGAGRVRLHGVRQFHALCSFTAYGLGMLRADVGLLGGTGNGIAEGLAAMSPGDVLIAASCKPYTRQVVDVCRVAHEHGMQTLVLTDYASSPLVRHSDVSILVPHETSFLSNSMVAFFAAAECLINACATVAGDDAATAISRRDRFIDELGIEMS